VLIFGVNTGLDYATLIAGVAGSAAAEQYRDPTHKLWKRLLEVPSAAVMSAFMAPMLGIAASGAFNLLPFVAVQTAPYDFQVPLAAILGFLAHNVILPGIEKIGRFKIRRYSGDN